LTPRMVCVGAIRNWMVRVSRPVATRAIAAAVVYMASDEASFVTGAILAVDGGGLAD